MKSILSTWKKSELNQSEMDSIIGTPVVDESLLEQIGGGRASAGWVCTISGECNASGNGCNPLPWE
ncbi:MAG: hypothetical protein ACOVS5_11330 [Oligoflexus sp.]